MTPLTEKQRAVYDFIYVYTDQNRCPPTQAEVALNMGFSQACSRHYYMALEKKGWIEIRPRLARGVLCLVGRDAEMSHANLV